MKGYKINHGSNKKYRTEGNIILEIRSTCTLLVVLTLWGKMMDKVFKLSTYLKKGKLYLVTIYYRIQIC